MNAPYKCATEALDISISLSIPILGRVARAESCRKVGGSRQATDYQ